MQGCVKKDLLKDTKRIGVIGLTYHTTVGNSLDMFNKADSVVATVGSNGITYKDLGIDSELLKFFDYVYSELQSAFNENGFEIITADQFVNNESFKQLKPVHQKTKTSIFDDSYVPQTYKPGDKKQDKEVLINLMKEEKLDAIARISFQLVRIKGKSMSVGVVGVADETLGLKFRVGLTYKTGKSIFSYSKNHIIKNETSMNLSSSFMGISKIQTLSPENKEEIYELGELFSTYIRLKIANAVK